MAVTGSGTEQDPWIVHNYDEFISLSGRGPVADSSVYIKWFDLPNQVLDCNTYGSEFKWGAFTDNAGLTGNVTFYIDLNGCTIKNFLIADGVTMFAGHYYSLNGNLGKIIISNGFIRNVFMGSATSKICGNYVEFHDVSISINASGSTVVPFDGADSHLIMDNCALYLVASTLSTSLIAGAQITDTDIELHVQNQNAVILFPGCSFTDCRVQGKISGSTSAFTDKNTVLGAITTFYTSNQTTNWVNCVVDLDLTDSQRYDSRGSYHVIYAYSGGINTNVICKSHFPTGMTAPSVWNYMTHEEIRDGAHLNDAGFTVVEIVGS